MKRKQIQLANLVHLVSSFRLDAIGYAEQWEDYEKYLQGIYQELCGELKIASIDERFLRYNWEGSFEEMPQTEEHNIPFNPQRINVIVPSLISNFNIRGDNRRVVLTYPKTYEGKQPLYQITLANAQQLKLIKVMPPLVKPFSGIGLIFEENGFKKLDELENNPSRGLIAIPSGELSIPASSMNYF